MFSHIPNPNFEITRVVFFPSDRCDNLDLMTCEYTLDEIIEEFKEYKAEVIEEGEEVIGVELSVYFDLKKLT